MAPGIFPAPAPDLGIGRSVDKLPMRGFRRIRARLLAANALSRSPGLSLLPISLRRPGGSTAAPS
eukprot:8491835-Pyramimonas_sp.AAC.1